MKKRVRFTSVLVVLLLTSMIFMGCNSNEMKVYDGFLKQYEMTSYESDMNIKANVSIEGLSEKEQMEAEQFIYMINNSDITIHQKMKRNEDQTKAKGEINLKMNLGGMVLDTGIWVDSDLTGEEMVLKEVLQLPPMMKMAMPEEYRNKDYMVIDFSDMNQAMEEEGVDAQNFKELMKLSKEFQPIVEEFLIEYAKDFNFKNDIVSYEGKERVDGETLSIYQVKLDDKTFKEFLKYSVETFIESDASEDLIKEYYSFIIKFGETMDLGDEEEKEELEEGLDEILNVFSEESREEVLGSVNEFFDKFEEVKLLGEKGLAINYKLDSKGNIVNTNGKIHLSIEPSVIENIQMEQEYTDEELTVSEESNVEEIIIDIELDFNTNIYNINKDINIEFPELTEENSINYFEILKMEEEMIENY